MFQVNYWSTIYTITKLIDFSYIINLENKNIMSMYFQPSTAQKIKKYLKVLLKNHKLKEKLLSLLMRCNCYLNQRVKITQT